MHTLKKSSMVTTPSSVRKCLKSTSMIGWHWAAWPYLHPTSSGKRSVNQPTAEYIGNPTQRHTCQKSENPTHLRNPTHRSANPTHFT
ncbi:hypothetical protein C8J57DRAFT_1729853 [Mycena rebaudengoi]|nr:hypothetical protein C8J57DRAFT_1729853 [Mycena rebaudengoi]